MYFDMYNIVKYNIDTYNNERHEPSLASPVSKKCEKLNRKVTPELMPSGKRSSSDYLFASCL